METVPKRIDDDGNLVPWDSNDTPEQAAVRAWLAPKGLDRLTDLFVAKSYTDIELMSEVGLEDADLDYLEITDAATRATLQGRVAVVTADKPKRAAKHFEQCVLGGSSKSEPGDPCISE